VSLNNFIVRNCAPEDLLRIIELLKLTGLFWGIGDSKRVFHEKLQFDPTSMLVLMLDDKIVGTVITIYDPWASFIYHLAIDPKYQGRGLGHLLAAEAEKRLKERGTTSVNGYVLPDNGNSRSFFKKRGYTDFFSPIILMEKPFT